MIYIITVECKDAEIARKPAEGTTLRVPDGNILLSGSVLGIAAAD